MTLKDKIDSLIKEAGLSVKEIEVDSCTQDEYSQVIDFLHRTKVDDIAYIVYQNKFIIKMLKALEYYAKPAETVVAFGGVDEITETADGFMFPTSFVDDKLLQENAKAFDEMT